MTEARLTYLIGGDRIGDKERFPYTVMKGCSAHIVPAHVDVMNFASRDETKSWIDDIENFKNLVAAVNSLGEVQPKTHRVEFLRKVVPSLRTFVARWGGDGVPHDIRAAMKTYENEWKLTLPEWPPDNVVSVDNLTQRGDYYLVHPKE